MGINEIIKIGNQIKLYRKQIGLSQAEMAIKLGIPRSTYANYENDTREPNVDILNKIFDIFGVSAFAVINGANIRFDNNGKIKSFKALHTNQELYDEYLKDMTNAVEYFISQVSSVYGVAVSYSESDLSEINNYLIKQTLLKLTELKGNDIILKAKTKSEKDTPPEPCPEDK